MTPLLDTPNLLKALINQTPADYFMAANAPSVLYESTKLPVRHLIVKMFAEKAAMAPEAFTIHLLLKNAIVEGR